MGEWHHHDVLGLDPSGFKIQERRERKTGDRIDIPTCQHGLAKRWIHRDPLNGPDGIGVRKDGKTTPARVKDRSAEFLAGKIARLGNPVFLQGQDSCGGVVVDHHDGHRLVGRVRIVGVKLHERSHVCEPHVIGARSDPRDRPTGTVTGIHRHIQARRLEIPLGNRRQKQRCGTLKPPVKLKLDRCLRTGRH